MRKMRCRVCGHHSEGFDYRDACIQHRKHFNDSHGRSSVFGYERLPERF